MLTKKFIWGLGWVVLALGLFLTFDTLIGTRKQLLSLKETIESGDVLNSCLWTTPNSKSLIRELRGTEAGRISCLHSYAAKENNHNLQGALLFFGVTSAMLNDEAVQNKNNEFFTKENMAALSQAVALMPESEKSWEAHNPVSQIVLSRLIEGVFLKKSIAKVAWLESVAAANVHAVLDHQDDLTYYGVYLNNMRTTGAFVDPTAIASHLYSYPVYLENLKASNTIPHVLKASGT